MLLTLAGKISRHLVSPLVVPAGGLIRKDFNDAWLLLTTEQGTLDWDYITRSVAALNCGGVLYNLIRDAGARAGRDLAPGECLARLAPGLLEKRFLAVAERATEDEQAPRGAAAAFSRKLALRLWPALSLLRHVRAAPRRVSSLAMVGADRSRELALRIERRLGRSTRRLRRRLIAPLRRLRRGSGSVCELGLTSPPEGALCEAHAARAGHPLSLDSDAARVLDAIRRLLPDRAELARVRSEAGAHLHWRFAHHCERVLFSIDTSSSDRD
jgi:hypothetical protein